MQRITSLLLPVLLFWTPALQSQALPSSNPEAQGMSSPRLERIETLLRESVQEGEIAGAVTLVVRNGAIVARDSAGVMQAGAGVPIRTDAIFRIASMTKPITSVAAMILVEEGILDLADPVARWIPEFERMQVAIVAEDGTMTTVPARRPITLRDLLVHRSGLTYGFLDRGPIGDRYRADGVSDGLGSDGMTLGENVRRLAAIPLVNQPGAAWQYGLSTDVLGRVIEVASGMPLDEFFQLRIFDPLRMESTGFSVPATRRSRLASMHARSDTEALHAIEGSEGSSLLSGGAGLFSSVDDYARFLQMMLNGGELDGVRILGPKTVQLMTVGHTHDLAGWQGGSGEEFGLGFSIVEDIGATVEPGSVGLYSWRGIWGTTFWVDPVEKLVAVGMIQLSGDAAPFQAGFRTAVYQAVTDSYERP